MELSGPLAIESTLFETRRECRAWSPKELCEVLVYTRTPGWTPPRGSAVAFQVEDLVDPIVVSELIRLNVLRVRHASIQDDQAIRLHLDEVQELPVPIPVVDVHIAGHGIAGLNMTVFTNSA